MSIKKWEEIAKQKEDVEKQRRNILNAFKERKVQDEMSLIGAEKPFSTTYKKKNQLPFHLQMKIYMQILTVIFLKKVI